MILSNIYRSPNSSGKENDSINNFVKSTSKYAHQLIVGDFNRKDINWDTATSPSDDDCKFVESIRDSYLTQHILTPTRGRGTSKPSLIDLLFTSKDECIENIEMHAPLGKSDHSLIKVSYRCEPEKLPDKIMCDYVKAGYQKMRQKLDINWEEYLGESKDDIDKMWAKFVRKYEKADIECVPRKVVKTGKNKFSFTLDRKSLAKRKKKY